jgi:hypothetical protein
MAYIKFNDREDFVKAVVMPAGNHVMRITADIEPDTSGFRIYLRANEDYPLDNGEYEACTTLYRQGEGWFELSDNGSVYTEPEVITLTPAEPTEEELAELERQQKIAGIQSQITALKDQLSATDYQIIKAYEYSLVGLETDYDIAVLHQERQSIRDQINELEEQLAKDTENADKETESKDEETTETE